MSSTPANEPPAGKTLERILKCKLLTKDNKETTFGDVIKGRRVVVLFIRHWFCIACQTFISKVVSQIPPSNLPKETSVVIIGCGGYQPINMYYRVTGCPQEYKLYAEPTRTIHNKDHFDFVLTMAGGEDGKRTDYEENLGAFYKRSLLSWKGAFRDPLLVPYTGSPQQNGGEFIFEEDGTCSFAHRMQNSGDHTEIEALAQAIGAQVTPSDKWKQITQIMS